MSEFSYWYIKRPAHKAFLGFVWCLPKKIVYWCVVRAAVEAEPREYPGDVTAMQMMKAMSE